MTPAASPARLPVGAARGGAAAIAIAPETPASQTLQRSDPRPLSVRKFNSEPYPSPHAPRAAKDSDSDARDEQPGRFSPLASRAYDAGIGRPTEAASMRLIYTLYEPAGSGPHPTIIAMHGFGANALDLLGLAPYIAEG